MSKKKTAPKVNEVEPNTQPAPVVDQPKSPATQSEFYQHAWNVLHKKLGKEEREHLDRNLKREPLIVRGKEITYQNIRSFVKDVAELGEQLYEKNVSALAAKTKVAK